MKKLFMVLAATFVCGAFMLTSCSKDEKNDEPTPPANNNVYEVNLTAIVHDCSAPYLMINLEYTDADGVQHTEAIKASDATDAILPEAQIYYNKETTPFRVDDETEGLYSHYKVKNIKLTVPAGKSFSFTSTCAAVPDCTAPTEEFSMIHPMVLVTARRVAGDSEDLSQYVKNSRILVKHNIETEPAGFDDAMTFHVGKTCGEGSFTF
ncbi:MAG: hypothetical protein ACSW8I_00965 [bacterium]